MVYINGIHHRYGDGNADQLDIRKERFNKARPKISIQIHSSSSGIWKGELYNFILNVFSIELI